MRERPTVVMLHGGPGIDHSPFKQPIFPPLTEIAQVIYYDQRGNGRSDRGSPSDWNLDTWADDVRRLCDAIGVPHPIVFGGSFGGFVALNYAQRHPDHPRKLILSSTAARTNPDRMCEMFEQLGGPEVARGRGAVPHRSDAREPGRIRARVPPPLHTAPWRPSRPASNRAEKRGHGALHSGRGAAIRSDRRTRPHQVPHTRDGWRTGSGCSGRGRARSRQRTSARANTLRIVCRCGAHARVEQPEAVMNIITEFILDDLDPATEPGREWRRRNRAGSGGGGFNMGEDPRRRGHQPRTCAQNATR